MSPKGGIRKRVLTDAEEAKASTPASSSSGRTGGVRRRVLAPPEQASGHADQPNDLLDGFKRDWAKGKLSSPQVQDYAARAAAQGAAGMGRAASAGSHGRHPQNLQRSLIALFGMPPGAPAFAWFNIPTKSGDVAHPFLLPHAWLQSLYSSKPELWQSAIQGPDGAVADFWEGIESTVLVRDHPSLDRSRTIPLGLHGDGGSFSKQDSLFVFTFNSLLGEGESASKRLLMTIIKKSELVPGTLDRMMDIMGWSFNIALTGLTPVLSYEGEQIDDPVYLAGRWKGSLIQIRGDWEFYCSIFGFPQWNTAESMCWLCKAAGFGDLAFGNCGSEAAWRATMQTHESWAADLEAKGKELPALMRRVAGLRLEAVMIDILHTVDLGVAAHIIGNIMWACVEQGVWPGGTQAERVAGLQAAVAKFYKDTRTTSRLRGDIKVEHLRTSGGWPKLKGKAAPIRHLAKFALSLATNHLDVRHRAIAQLLVQFYDTIKTEGMFLSDEATRVIPQIGLRLGVLYAQLGRQALIDGVKAWKVMPKLHLFQHLCQHQSILFGNPRFYWTYADEDMVGHLVEVGATCHPRTLAVTALYKWLTFCFAR